MYIEQSMEGGEVQYNRRQKMILKKEIEKLDYAEYCELFKIIVKQTDKFTINKGGVFFNMKNLNNETLTQIHKFIEFSKENKKMLDMPRDIREPKAEVKAVANIETDYEKFSADMEVISSDEEEEDNDAMKNFMENKSKVIGYDDNFKFSNYIEKLQTANNKKFADAGNEIVLRPSKLKLTGVKARLMKRCRDMVVERIVAPSVILDEVPKKSTKKVKTEEDIIMELNASDDDTDTEEVEDSFETL